MQKSMFYAVKAFLHWLLAGALVGAICGVVGALFALAVEEATELSEVHAWLLYLLPLGGIAIVAIYKGLKLPLTIGTDEIIRTVRTQEPVPILLAPAIFVSTFITHLLDGSAGREGAALQLGGSIGAAIGDRLHPKGDMRRIFELCGMAALFSALFGTPLTAAIFVLEIIEVGRINHRALLPCFSASITATLVAKAVGAPEEPWFLASGLQAVNARSLLSALGIGIAAALCAMLFVTVMHAFGKRARKLVGHDMLRAAIGGVSIILLTLIVGSRDYNGGGMGVIFAALKGQARPEAFLLKMLFTAVTLSFGFKGGEIVPSFFIGATMGATVAPIIGFSPALGAALGLIGVFCGVTNAPLAALMLSIELFGSEYLLLFGATVAVAYMLSGHSSLYHEQHFSEPKLGHFDEP